MFLKVGSLVFVLLGPRAGSVTQIEYVRFRGKEKSVVNSFPPLYKEVTIYRRKPGVKERRKEMKR